MPNLTGLAFENASWHATTLELSDTAGKLRLLKFYT